MPAQHQSTPELEAPAAEAFVDDPAPAILPLGARAAIVVTDRGRHYTVAPETGEILTASEPLPNKAPRRIHIGRDVGIDTKWPSEARDSEELAEALQTFDHWLDRLHLEEGKLLGLLRTGTSGPAISLLQHLSEQLAGRNYWFGWVEDLSESLSMPPRTVRATLKELEDAGLIQRKAQGKKWPTRIAIHPWYAWRGDLSGRERAIGDWVSRQLRPARFCRQSPLEP